MDSLEYVSFELPDPLEGQIQVEIHAAGLNFSDVLKAMGLYPGIKDAIVPLGIECAGTVTAVGPGVNRFRVGDPVMGVAPYSFGSHTVTADYAMVHKTRHSERRRGVYDPDYFLDRLLRVLSPGESTTRRNVC